MTGDPVENLLAEVRRRGIELQAHGDKVRFRPKAAMTPELLDRLKPHKLALLAILRPAAAPALVSGVPVPGIAPRGPRELSLDEKVATGYVNPGWNSTGWAQRLRQMADRCQPEHPAHGSKLREWAKNVERGGV